MRFFNRKPKKLSPAQQGKLNYRMIFAAKNGHTETVQTLLAANADVHAQEDDALCLAAEYGHTETVKALLVAGANVHTENDHALIDAARNGRTETVKVLLAAGANMNGLYDGMSLYDVAMNGHVETVKVLLAAGANVRVMNDRALRYATVRSHKEVVQVLAAHIFASDSWRGKSRVEIEAQADALYGKIKFDNPEPEDLRMAGTILLDRALRCWEQVRPAPPPLTISPLPAQPRPL